MYLTQGNFFGKTGPMDPQRKQSENPKFEDKYYPNPWMEARNLKTIHTRVSSVKMALTAPNFKGSLLGNTITEND